jgi:hypothetical protein
MSEEEIKAENERLRKEYCTLAFFNEPILTTPFVENRSLYDGVPYFDDYI